MNSASSEPILEEPPQESDKSVHTSIPPKQTYVRSFQRKLRIVLEPVIEQCFRNLFFWETDDKQIGWLIRSFHSNILAIIFIVYWISHTVLHSYWLLWFIWIILGTIWLQHMVTGCCILTRIEQRLIGDKSCVLDPMMRLFQIPVTNENGKGLTIFLSTTFFFLQSLELYTRTVLNIQSFLYFLPHIVL